VVIDPFGQEPMLKSVSIALVATLLSFVPCYAAELSNAPSATVGRTPIALPVPDGYVSTTEIPALKTLAETVTQATHRLLVGLFRKEDVVAWRNGQPLKTDRYFLIQTERQAEAESMTQAEYARLKSALKQRVAARIVGNDATANRQTTDAQRQLDASLPALRRQFALPPIKMSLGETTILGISEDQTSSVSTASATKLSAASEGKTVDTVMVSVSTVLLCKGKLINIYGYSTYRSPDDLNWLQGESSRLVATLSAANQ
jgi:hypothetical protein